MADDIRNHTLAELQEKFEALGLERYRAAQVYEWLYKKDAENFSDMANLPQKTREALRAHFSIEKISVQEIETSIDLTQKFLFKLKDDALIESVSIPARDRLTACLSTQVGCRFSCAFCASGALGFKRNLKPFEILAQYLAIRKNVPLHKITNVVFMGVGEPLDNYENLVKAIRIMNSDAGIRLGARKMTISTSGLPEGIEKLAKEGLQLELSVSLHAALDSKRSVVLPVNNKFPIGAVMVAVKKYIALTKRKVTFEYILLGGYNTSVEDAQALVELLRGLNVRVNLIPYNPSSSRIKFQPPAKSELLFFKSFLTKKGLDVTLRVPRGMDITAACGQLRSRAMQKG
jgi:23S rRNA (adenine2503-C2)-methyltransferase